MIRPTVFLSGNKKLCFNYELAFGRAGFSTTFDDFSSCDALCLCGGGDLSPCLYGSVNKGSFDIDIKRDIEELYYLRRALDCNIPVFAVCRGLQLVNVYFGGTLRQSVQGHDKINGSDRYHLVEFSGDLASVFGKTAFVNSAHHQAVGTLGKGLTVTAKAKDGVIEAFSHKNLTAFQFHPERLAKEEDKNRIFSKFYSDNFG